MYNAHRYNAVRYNERTHVTGSIPTMSVWIAFASDAFAASPIYDDVTPRATALDIRRGRQHELGRFEAGTARLTLDNSDGDLWPNNTGGSYYPNVLPAKRIGIKAKHGATTYDIFTGFIEDWLPDWLQRPNKGAFMIVSAADLIKNLSRYNLNDGVGYSAELSGTRVGNVLDDISWPAGARSIAAGKSTMQASGALENEQAMSHLFTIQDSEYGSMFIAGDGDVVYLDRHTRLLNSPYDTSQATFGDDPGEMKYHRVAFSYDDEYIYNNVKVQRRGGTAQTADDTDSQDNYGTRSLARTNLEMNNDNDALDQATFLRSKYKNPKLRVKSIKIWPGGDPANLFPKVLGYDIGTRITLRLNEASIDEDYYIDGIRHHIDMRKGKWETEWQLIDTQSLFWILGTVGYSELGETTELGF